MTLHRVLRLFHISDVHFGRKPPAAWKRQRHGVAAVMRTLAQNLQGLSVHDASALYALERALCVTASDPQWRDKTWLVCTGDLSTWGDDKSIAAALQWLRRIASRAGLPDPNVTFIYGNHDVWPAAPWSLQGHPVGATDPVLAQRHDRLRRSEFAQTWPLVDIATVRLPGTSRQLRVHSLNTVRHERRHNILATGEVGPDRYWQAPSSSASPQDVILASATTGDDVGIVLTHHPVHDASCWPKGMQAGPLTGHVPAVMRVLTNAGSVAATLAAPSTGQAAAHIVVSGHVHDIVPAIHQLPQSAPTCAQAPLSRHQIQLSVGTVSQAPVPFRQRNAAKPFEQHWQELRFLFDDTNLDELIVERIVYSRNNATGRFAPRAAANDPSATAERIMVPIT